jgi:predicted Rossmann-fold nucleotide-binding protein
VVLFGKEFWDKVLNFQPMLDLGTISPEDREIYHETDSVDEAFEYLTTLLLEWALAHPGGKL